MDYILSHNIASAGIVKFFFSLAGIARKALLFFKLIQACAENINTSFYREKRNFARNLLCFFMNENYVATFTIYSKTNLELHK